MDNMIVLNAQEYLGQLFRKDLSPDHRLHDLAFALGAKEAALHLGKRYQLSDDQLEPLALAALFRYAGMTQTYRGYAPVSRAIAKDFMKKSNYPSGQTDKVLTLLEDVEADEAPNDLAVQILHDADCHLLMEGPSGGLAMLAAQRQEWAALDGQTWNNEEWTLVAHGYWKKMQLLTAEGQVLMGDTRKQLLKQTKEKGPKKEKQKEKPEKKKSKNKPEEDETPITVSRSVQMMFKTALRNHINLTNIADNKANIMLSINALIITFSMPLLATNVKENSFLLAPSIILLISCVVSIIFATLATRPVQTKGYTSMEKIKNETTNLFFFGNFYKMNLKDYKAGIDVVIGNEHRVADSIVTDLYFLGKALGVKFNRLRICYSVFMFGITCTVIAFGISYMLSRP